MEIRPARAADAVAIRDIINHHAELGRMLHRSLEAIYESLRNFVVAEDAERVIGCAAVEIFWADLAEVRSLALEPDSIGKGVGRQLVERAIDDTRRLGIARLFTLTYEREFFDRCGFREITKETLPSKVWTDCICCTKRNACDEIAMILEISAATGVSADGAAPDAAQR